MAQEVTFSIKINDSGTTKQVTADAEELGRVIRSVQDEADKLKNKVVTWAQAAQAAETLNNAVGQLQSIMTDLTAAYQVQMVAETQLKYHHASAHEQH